MKRKNRSKPVARLEWNRHRNQNPEPTILHLQKSVFTDQANLATESGSRLIRGDNLGVMTALLSEWENKVDLIYADPPFLSGKTYNARIGRDEDSRRPSEWRTVEGYQDEWPNRESYLDMLFPRLELMHKLLAPSGSLYLHLDWHASAYARVLLDEIFGPDRLLNEIVWVYHGPSPIRSAFKRKHDTILLYTKSKRYTFNADAVRVPYAASTIKTFASSSKAGFGKKPDLERGKVPEDWWYFPVVARLHNERTGYPTQKPEALLERIILASSNPGDMVADFFCGSGTTPVLASRLDRLWLACDHSPMAIHASYRRLLLASVSKTFTTWETVDQGKASHPLPLIALHQDGNQVTVTLTRLESSDSSSHYFPDDIDYWEIDWDFDSVIFRSRSHAVRSWRSAGIDLKLTHTYPAAGEYTLCVQVADSHGKAVQNTHPIKVPSN